MKQKRKVKALLPAKSGKGILSFLLIIGGSLCLWATGLLSLVNGIIYRGINDKQESLYDISFIESIDSDLDPGKVVNRMFMKNNNTLFVSGNSLIVPGGDGNFLEGGKFGNILGGKSNTIKSDGITMIAGFGNSVDAGNDNATIMGGNTNYLKGDNDKSILLGGENNVVSGSNGANILMIGGKNNEVWTNSSNVNMLGGIGNIVEDNNVIVGGSNVSVKWGASDTFVFSDGGDSFSLNGADKSNAFYLNVLKGLGINTGASRGGVESMGSVSLGSIDIQESCDDSNLGIQGVWDGCLVGCTKESKGRGWELLDRGEKCNRDCESSDNCIVPEWYDDFENDEEGSCTNYDIYQAAQCSTGSEKKYKNVIFETVLRDYDDRCPSGENKCEFYCPNGTHLYNGGCYKDCTIPGVWTIRHGEERDRHNGTYSCNDGDLTLIVCDSEYHTEGNEEMGVEICESNTKEVYCENVGAWKPEPGISSNFVPDPVSIHWIGRWNNGRWSSPECKWECAGSYHKEYDVKKGQCKCVENIKTVPCVEGGKPEHSNYIKKDVMVAWKSTGTWGSGCSSTGGNSTGGNSTGGNLTGGNLTGGSGSGCVSSGCWDVGYCKWECEDGYVQVGSLCVKAVCKGVPPSHSIVNNEEATPKNNTTEYFYDENSMEACAFRCEDEYKYNSSENLCEKQKVDCSNLPDGAKGWVVPKFTQSWIGNEWTPTSKANVCVETSSSTIECSFTCDIAGGYICNVKGGDHCIPNINNCGTKPVGNGYKFGSGTYTSTGGNTKTWTYTGSENPGECEFTCLTGFGYVGKVCKPDTNLCTGDVQKGTGVIWGTGRYEYGYEPIIWTYTESANPGACEFTCDTTRGIIWEGGKCRTSEYNCTDADPEGEGVILGRRPINADSETPWKYKAGAAGSADLAICEWTCNEFYERDGTNKSCKPKTNQGICLDLPANASGWVKGTFNQIGTLTGWVPVITGNKCVTTPSSTSDCSFMCKDGYICNVKGGTGCISNENSCGTKPSGSGYNKFGIDTYTSGSRVTRWTYTGSNNPGPCEFNCKSDFEPVGNICKPKTYDCREEMPTGKGYITGAKTYVYGSEVTSWTYTENKRPGSCEFTCNTETHSWNGEGCVPNTYSCSDDVPKGALVILGGVPTSGGQVKNWTYTGSNNPGPCEWTCTGSSHPQGKTCLEDKPYNIRISCGTSPENSDWSNPEFTQTWDESSGSYIPSSQHRTCVAKKSDIECSFICREGFECDGDVGCKKKTNDCGEPKPSGEGVKLRTGEYTSTGGNTKTWTYTGSSEPGVCEWTCIGHYHQNGIGCAPDTKDATCGDKPTHAARWLNNNGEFVQTWDTVLGWYPSVQESMICVDRGSTSNKKCAFECETNFKCSGKTTCVPVEASICTGTLSDTAEPNNNKLPTETKSYFYAPGSTEACSFDCKKDACGNKSEWIGEDCKWKEYTLNYNCANNGGSWVTSCPKSVTVTGGESVILGAPTLDAGGINGWQFVGWSTNPNATDAEYEEGSKYSMCGESNTLYAIYKRLVSVRFMTTQDSTLVLGEETCKGRMGCSMWMTYNMYNNKGVVFNVPEVLLADGEEFVGWRKGHPINDGDSRECKADDGYNRNNGTYTLGADVDGIITLGGITKITVVLTFDSRDNDGNRKQESVEICKQLREDYVIPDFEPYPGYTKIGWTHYKTYPGGDMFNPGDDYTVRNGLNNVFYAHSSKTSPKPKIIFDANGNNGNGQTIKEIGSEEIVYDGGDSTLQTVKITCLAVPTPAGFTQMGWSDSSSVYNEVCSAGKQITLQMRAGETKTLYAWTKREPKVDITFNWNGNNPSQASKKESCGVVLYNGAEFAGCQITSPQINVGSICTKNIIGWSTASTRYQNDWTPGETKTVKENKSYYAQTYNSPEKCYVKFNANGNTFKYDSQIYNSNVRVEFCSTETSRNNNCTNGQQCRNSGMKYPQITPYGSNVVWGWSKNQSETNINSADKKTPGSSIYEACIVGTDLEFYAHSTSTIGIDFNAVVNKCWVGNYNRETCTRWNNKSCTISSVKSPTISPSDGYDVIGFNRNKNATSSEWGQSSMKNSVTISENENYYCIVDIINHLDCIGVNGETVSHGETYVTYGSGTPLGLSCDQYRMEFVCNNGVWELPAGVEELTGVTECHESCEFVDAKGQKYVNRHGGTKYRYSRDKCPCYKRDYKCVDGEYVPITDGNDPKGKNGDYKYGYCEECTNGQGCSYGPVCGPNYGTCNCGVFLQGKTRSVPHGSVWMCEDNAGSNRHRVTCHTCQGEYVWTGYSAPGTGAEVMSGDELAEYEWDHGYCRKEIPFEVEYRCKGNLWGADRTNNLGCSNNVQCYGSYCSATGRYIVPGSNSDPINPHPAGSDCCHCYCLSQMCGYGAYPEGYPEEKKSKPPYNPFEPWHCGG